MCLALEYLVGKPAGQKHTHGTAYDFCSSKQTARFGDVKSLDFRKE